MRSNWSSLQTGVSKATVFLVMVVERIVGAGRSVASTTWNLLRWLVRALRARGNIARDRTSTLLSGPVKRFVVGPLQVILLGKRRDVSLLVLLLAPALALGTAWWVGSTVGYETVAEWVRGTWYGTSPSVPVFIAAALLVALAAISAAVNSGLLPTTVLVAAPLFGTAVTRYGTEVTYSWGTTTVSLPEAVGVATMLSFTFGLPLAVCGFLVGSAVRRIVAVIAGGPGPSSNPERA